jgi:hypothetical protein
MKPLEPSERHNQDTLQTTKERSTPERIAIWRSQKWEPCSKLAGLDPSDRLSTYLLRSTAHELSNLVSKLVGQRCCVVFLIIWPTFVLIIWHTYALPEIF